MTPYRKNPTCKSGCQLIVAFNGKNIIKQWAKDPNNVHTYNQVGEVLKNVLLGSPPMRILN